MNNVLHIGLAYMVTLVAFAVLDGVWLMSVGAAMFQAQLGAILRPEPMLGAAIAFYPIYAFGLLVLVVRPALDVGSMSVAATKGAVLGLTAYATFDLTSLAVIQQWTFALAAVDIAWGVVASAIASMAGTFAGLRYGSSSGQG